MRTAKDKVIWISILQAITITAVMIGHVDIAGDMNSKYPIATFLDRFMGFQMPVFMFISGFLYVRSSLFDKSYKQLILSKLKRLGIPFLFISLVMYAFKLQLDQSSLEHPVELSLDYVMKIFFEPWNGPVRHLWFLESLFSFFALIPLYQWTLEKKRSVASMIVIAYLFTFIPTLFPNCNLEVLSIRKSSSLFVCFYLGMVAMKYDWIHWFQNKTSLCLSAILYILGFFLPIPFHGIIGIPFVLSLSWWLSKVIPSLFESYRNYTYQIYLMHMPPIMVCKMIYNKGVLDDSIWFPCCWILCLLCSIYLPTLISMIVERFFPKFKILIGL